MQYPGGKTRAIRGIVGALQAAGVTGPFWEPFCGGLGASIGLTKAFGPGLHSDANEALIALYCAVQDGWQPPERVSEEEYRAAKALPRSNPLHAFCAAGCSFAAKWWGGYARNSKGQNYAGRTRRALLRDCALISRPFVADFCSSVPFFGPGFVYCDPPYAGTLPYRGAPPFDHAAFWQKAEEWSTFCPVFVSEYAAPEGWRCVWQASLASQVSGGNGGGRVGTERLFILDERAAA